MKFEIVEEYKPAISPNKRYVILMGGRSAGRSYFASQLIAGNLADSEYFRCALMRFIAGDIRQSIFQEVLDRLEEQGVQDYFNIKENTLEIEYNGNYVKGIGFRKSTSDQKSKMKSLANFNHAFIEEADEVAEEDFTQFDDSLRKKNVPITIYLLLNAPPKGHWIIKRWFNLQKSEIDGYYDAELKDSVKDNTMFINTNFTHNIKNVNESTIENFNKYKTTKPEHYYNMIMGLVSEGLRGRIFKNWKIIPDKEFDELPYPVSYGLDFGFTNDPTALVAIKTHNDNVWLKQLIYKTGLLNKHISAEMKTLEISKEAEIYADSAEPKTIKELQEYGWNIIPANKAPDSVTAGYNLMLGKTFHYTESSTDIDKEAQNHTWALDKNKEPTNEPKDEWNHALDGTRYNLFTKSQKKEVGFY